MVWIRAMQQLLVRSVESAKGSELPEVRLSRKKDLESTVYCILYIEDER